MEGPSETRKIPTLEASLPVEVLLLILVPNTGLLFGAPRNNGEKGLEEVSRFSIYAREENKKTRSSGAMEEEEGYWRLFQWSSGYRDAAPRCGGSGREAHSSRLGA